MIGDKLSIGDNGEDLYLESGDFETINTPGKTVNNYQDIYPHSIRYTNEDA